MIKHIFLDFNGTLLDDVDLCLELLNWMLKDQNKELVDINKYKNIFTFPVSDYYIKAGIDFNIESFDSLAHRFMDRYTKDYVKCKLYDGVKDTLLFLRTKGYKLYILSASKQSILNMQCEHFHLTHFFDDIIGVNDIYATSKEKTAIDYIKLHDINPDEAIFIGDTLHDNFVANQIGTKSMLVLCGHQSRDVLKKANVRLIDDINSLREDYDEIFN